MWAYFYAELCLFWTLEPYISFYVFSTEVPIWLLQWCHIMLHCYFQQTLVFIKHQKLCNCNTLLGVYVIAIFVICTRVALKPTTFICYCNTKMAWKVDEMAYQTADTANCESNRNSVRKRETLMQLCSAPKTWGFKKI